MYRFIHYSDSFLGDVESREQSMTETPSGLWFSVERPDPHPSDPSWRDWIEHQMKQGKFPQDARVMLRCKTELELDLDEVCWIRDADELDEFSERFWADGASCHEPERQIDWTEVARHFGGLIIAPVIWSRIKNTGATPTLWYRLWGAGKGVVWDRRAVVGLSPLR